MGYFCGGIKNTEGYIYKTSDGGNTWVQVYKQNASALHDILFVNDSVAYACGENMLLLRSTDHGNTWKSTGNEINSDKFYNGTLYGLFGNEQLLYLAGGNNFNVGIINWVKDNTPQTYWTGFKGTDNEFRCGTFFSNGNYMAFGYGNAHLRKKEAGNFEPTGINGDFFTACCFISDTERMLCGYNGGIYRLYNYGTKIEKLLDHNRAFKKRINLRGIAFLNAQTGWAVGNNGVALKTINGKDFEPVNLDTTDDLTSAVVNKKNQVVVSTSSGKLIFIGN